MDGWDAAALARAVPYGAPHHAHELQAGVEHASAFTWRRTAGNVRDALVAAIGTA